MKNEYKVWRDKSWFLWSFKKNNTTLIWNDNNKTYEFVKGIVGEKSKPVLHKPIRTTMKYYYWSVVLAGLVGILLAIICYMVYFQ